MNIKRFSICLFTLFISLGRSQTLTVNGQVFDEQTKQPIAGANVVSGEKGTTTDSQGQFILTISKGDPITLSHIGYHEQTLFPKEDRLIVYLGPRVIPGEAVIVRGGLSDESLNKMASSVTVFDRFDLHKESGNHFQYLTQSIPNLNWAGGTSRPRYFQIRGIGERSQYAGDGPPNFSVGFVMDDVDLSGTGMAGLLFDLSQVEVFRGPQSSIFGSNAMAGLISLHSANPTEKFIGYIKTTIGSDNIRRAGLTISGPLSKSVSLRFSTQTGNADGFRKNVYHNRTDTNSRAETLVRGKIDWKASSKLHFLFTAFQTNLDNGYDAWAPDNNGFTNYSDRLGKDSQKTTAISLRGIYSLPESGMEILSLTSQSLSNLEHSYDGDWGNEDFWKGEPFNFDPEVEGWSYDFYDKTLRNRITITQELRLTKNLVEARNSSLILGIYYKNLQEEDNAKGYLFGGDDTELSSTFLISNFAGYCQYETYMTDRIQLIANVRFDLQKTEYEDDNEIFFDIKDRLFGGKGSLKYFLSDTRIVFGSISRGYKAGGINQHPRLAEDNRPFKPEYILNFEAGFRSFTDEISSVITVFYAQRENQQVSLSSQQDPGDPNSFIFYIGNATTGQNYGLELESKYRLNNTITFVGSLGLLNTHVDSYSFPIDTSKSTTLGDREQAHAPRYTFRIGANFRFASGFFGQIELVGKDKFYFSDSHDQMSNPYQLLNGSLGYDTGRWILNLWAKNIFDDRYATRGFYFGLEPPNYEDKLYTSLGDPAHYGLTFEYKF